MQRQMASDGIANRITLAVAGAIAGVAMWLLAEVLAEPLRDSRALLPLASFLGVGFAAFLVLAGPVGLRRAAGLALCVAVPVAALLFWAGFRFDRVEGLFETPYALVAAFLTATIPVPFLLSAARDGEGWSDYPALFTHAWTIFVRYAGAWVFVGVVWAVLFLSDEFLGLVGIEIIGDIIDLEPVPYVVTGAVLGLALAVVDELSDYVSPTIILRLLRLLLPVALVVVAVFILALPFQGMEKLFGSFSAAGMMMAIAAGCITLITTALDRDNAAMVQGRGMRAAAQAMALLLPVLSVIAVMSVYMRVRQYGWTPDRIAAAVLAVLILGYAVLYAVAVLRSLRSAGDWAGRIRHANVLMALATVAVAVLSLTPVLNAERISARDQVAWFEDGKTKAADLPIWEMKNDWGRAGQAGLTTLAAMQDHPEAAEVANLLKKAETMGSWYEYEAAKADATAAQTMEGLAAQIMVRPVGALVPPEFLKSFSSYDVESWAKACAHKTAAGNPGCAIIMADFMPNRPGQEALTFLWQSDSWVERGGMSFDHEGGGVYRNGTLQLSAIDGANGASDVLFDTIAANRFTIAPAGMQSLRIGTEELMVAP